MHLKTHKKTKRIFEKDCTCSVKILVLHVIFCIVFCCIIFTIK